MTRSIARPVCPGHNRTPRRQWGRTSWHLLCMDRTTWCSSDPSNRVCRPDGVYRCKNAEKSNSQNQIHHLSKMQSYMQHNLLCKSKEESPCPVSARRGSSRKRQPDIGIITQVDDEKCLHASWWADIYNVRWWKRESGAKLVHCVLDWIQIEKNLTQVRPNVCQSIGIAPAREVSLLTSSVTHTKWQTTQPEKWNWRQILNTLFEFNRRFGWLG